MDRMQELLSVVVSMVLLRSSSLDGQIRAGMVAVAMAAAAPLEVAAVGLGIPGGGTLRGDQQQLDSLFVWHTLPLEG